MGVSRILFAVVFLALTVSAVNAYTVIMRDGRRVEIPNEFTVTNSTLTYDAGSGIQVTIQLNTVDITATERANGEARGAFLNKANAGKIQSAPQTRPTRTGRSITNADLEKYRQARVANEKAYEDRRQELGLPSMEDRQREVAEIQERTLEQVRSMRAQEEAYWRTRAEAMRAEVAASEAQLGFRQQPADIPWSFSSLGGGFPFDNFGFGIGGGRFNRFRRLSSSPFDGFLATPITPFPRFSNFPRPVFRAPGVSINPRPVHGRHR
jgi:hypothetical protein